MGVLEPTPQALSANQAITEVIHRYCRAMDRMDRELALSCWHPGGTDDHAPNFVGSAEGFVTWVWSVHERFIWTRHEAANILIDLDGDLAGVESYCSIVLRAKRGDELYDIFTSGRYLDRFQRIDGAWAISHRQSLSEWHRVERVATSLADFQDPPFFLPAPTAGVRLKPTRDRTDPSYAVLSRGT